MDGVYKSSAEKPNHLRIAFIHPDLGIGGAERLVVDAAVGLKQKGHVVDVFTSHHDPRRSFIETRDGTLPVHVLGGWLFPRSIFGKFTIVMAILRQFHLTLCFLFASWLRHFAFLPILSWLVIPADRAFADSRDWSIRRQLPPYDVVIVDQLSTCVPLLRWFGQNRVIFYCHFPDLLLSSSSSANASSRRNSTSVAAVLRSAYRIPIDMLEQKTTGQADKILVNSNFTSKVFQETFPDLRRLPRVVYPGVDVDAFARQPSQTQQAEHAWLDSNEVIFLSINRFERKKDIALAVDAFALYKKQKRSGRLILAGGFDPRLADNIQTVRSLQSLAKSLNLSVHTYSAEPQACVQATASKPSTSLDVLILLNMSGDQKVYLLTNPRTLALLYTPSFEHLGIVPLEAMSAGLAIIATKTGGPTETVIDEGLPPVTASTIVTSGTTTTGLLREPDAVEWSKAMDEIGSLSEQRRSLIRQAGRNRARNLFSLQKLADEFEQACKDTVAIRVSIYDEQAFQRLVLFVVLAFFVFGTATLVLRYA